MSVARFSVLLACLVTVGFSPLRAQEDPSAEFFAAYQEYQRAERLEREGRNADAIAKFRYVAAQLSQIKSQNPDWQPLVVDFRLRKTQEAVVRLEGSLDSQTLGPPPDLVSSEDDALPPLQPARRESATAGPSISIAPPADAEPTRLPVPTAPRASLPDDTGQLRSQLEAERERNTELQAQIQRGEAEFSSVSMELEKTKVSVVDLTTQLRNLQEAGTPAPEGASQEELDRLSGKAKELEESLNAVGEEKAQLDEQVAASTKQIEELTAQLSEAQADAEKAKADLAGVQGEIDTAKAEAEQAKARTTELESEKETLVTERDSARQEAETVRGELTSLTARVTELEEERTQLIAARDTAQQEAAEAKTALEKSADLIEANQQLEQKLAEAAQRITGMESDAAEKTTLIASLNADLDKVREELAGAQVKLKDDRERFDKLQAVNDQLLKEYDQVTGALAAVKLGDVTAAEAKLIQQENEVLRSIIMRQIKEQARREQAYRLAQEEMERLEIRSDTLNDKINELAKPTLELSAAEQEMLKRPVVTLLDTDAAVMSAQIEVLKPQADESTPAEEAAAPDAAATPESTAVTEVAAAETATEPAAAAEEAPPTADREGETAALVAEARAAFLEGNFAKAEELYQKFVEQQPDNVVALANLGVAQFRQGKLTAAQLALERAIKADPNDAFSLTTLGAVMIEQSRIEDAIGYLERANDVQADDPITLNYLGVASSQIGQFGKAEQSLRRAIAVKPEYAEAHFNLAVIYATAKPPSIALAKRHYEKALELGSSPDQRLATMLQLAPGS